MSDTIPAFTSMLSVFAAEDRCSGFVMRCRHEFEAFDFDGKSIGMFASVHDAVAAVLEKE